MSFCLLYFQYSVYTNFKFQYLVPFVLGKWRLKSSQGRNENEFYLVTLGVSFTTANSFLSLFILSFLLSTVFLCRWSWWNLNTLGEPSVGFKQLVLLLSFSRMTAGFTCCLRSRKIIRGQYSQIWTSGANLMRTSGNILHYAGWLRRNRQCFWSW
jgi:hypothetical protein